MIQEEEEELEEEQEEKYDEEGLPEIPNTSQPEGTQEIIPPTSHDSLGTIPPLVLVSNHVPFGSTISHVFENPGVVIYTVPSTTTNVLALDTPQDNIENVFLPNLSEVFSSMLEYFDKFMSETKLPPKVSVVENPPAIVTFTNSIVTTSIQNHELSSQVLSTRVEDDTPLPPWLVSNTPKRKKQAISPNDFDFSHLVPVKPKGTKKAKTLSRVKDR